MKFIRFLMIFLLLGVSMAGARAVKLHNASQGESYVQTKVRVVQADQIKFDDKILEYGPYLVADVDNVAPVTISVLWFEPQPDEIKFYIPPGDSTIHVRAKRAGKVDVELEHEPGLAAYEYTENHEH